MLDKIVGTDAKGNIIYEDIKGEQYMLIDAPPTSQQKSEQYLKQPSKDEANDNTNDLQSSMDNDVTIERNKNMAEITELTLLKRDMDEQHKDLHGQLSGLTKDINVTKEELKTLDKKVCDGDKCRDEQEKKQTQNYGDILERLKKLEGPSYVCEKCGVGVIRPGDKTCPHCGEELEW